MRFAEGSYISDVQLTTNRGGDLLLVWHDYDRLQTAFLPYGGTWEPGPVLRGRLDFDTVGVALNDRDEAVVMWRRTTEMGDYARRYLGWSMRSADGSWTPSRFLDTRPRPNVLGVDLIDVKLNERGQALAAWATQEEGPSTSRVARFPTLVGRRRGTSANRASTRGCSPTRDRRLLRWRPGPGGGTSGGTSGRMAGGNDASRPSNGASSPAS